MKDQYFGDVKDYTKYAILRCFIDEPKIIHWMQTTDNNRKDGRKLKYLENRANAHLDVELWEYLRQKVCHEKIRNVQAIEGKLGLVLKYEKRPIDVGEKRDAIFDELCNKVSQDNIVFLDPDNGYQVPSVEEGRTNSKKYVYKKEIDKLLDRHAIVILFQHFRRSETVETMVHNFHNDWQHINPFYVRTSEVIYYFLSKRDIYWCAHRIKSKENQKPNTKVTVHEYITADSSMMALGHGQSESKAV
ncbi:MAG: hypothetical protein D4R88_01365 [Methanosarcinales archaeon]|nr:MAG: hypothetical protein D4R88_01365 [Methanosarcinales archaeon]